MTELKCSHCRTLRPYTPGESVLFCGSCGEWYSAWEFALCDDDDDDGRGFEVWYRLPGPEGERVR